MQGTAPSPARLLAAGQKGELLSCEPVLMQCRAATVPGKGRGLLAATDTPANGLLHLEPAVASAAAYPELAAELRRCVEGPGSEASDDLLLGQLLSLCAWGEEPTSVPEVPAGDELTYLARRPPARDASARLAARRQLLGDDAPPEAEEGAEGAAAFSAKLLERLKLIAQSNAFRSAVDPLGALAYHSLNPREQSALAEQSADKVPQPKLWMFLRASLFNHSEAPNATWLVAGGLMMVRAAVDIKAGEEVLLSYWPDVDASDAMSFGLMDGFGVSQDTAGAAEELALPAEGRARLQRLKSLPFAVAEKLEAIAGAGGDVAAAFDAANATLAEELRTAEKELPKHLHAFLEPRFIQAQLSMQSSAILTARGEEKQGDQMRRLGLARMSAALDQFSAPWGKRVLLRLIFALKGSLRPAPAGLLGGAASEAGGTTQGDFAVRLAQQACATKDELKDSLERAVEAVFGDSALLPAVLGKCGVA